MAKVSFVGKQELEVFVDPRLDFGNLPELIGEEAEKLVGNDISVLRVKATPWAHERKKRPDMVRLDFYCCGSGNREMEIFVIEIDERGGYSLQYKKQIYGSGGMPCH